MPFEYIRQVAATNNAHDRREECPQFDDAVSP